MILRGGAEHTGATDVDVFYALLEGGTLGNSGLEGVEVEDGNIDNADVVVDHVLLVLCKAIEVSLMSNKDLFTLYHYYGSHLLVASDGKEASVDLGMKCLDATVEALGGLGVLWGSSRV